MQLLQFLIFYIGYFDLVHCSKRRHEDIAETDKKSVKKSNQQPSKIAVTSGEGALLDELWLLILINFLIGEDFYPLRPKTNPLISLHLVSRKFNSLLLSLEFQRIIENQPHSALARILHVKALD